MNSKELDKIWTHIETINSEMGDVKAHISGMKTDISWLKKFQWVILTAALSGVVITLIKILIGG